MKEAMQAFGEQLNRKSIWAIASLEHGLGRILFAWIAIAAALCALRIVFAVTPIDCAAALIQTVLPYVFVVGAPVAACLIGDALFPRADPARLTLLHCWSKGVRWIASRRLPRIMRLSLVLGGFKAMADGCTQFSSGPSTGANSAGCGVAGVSSAGVDCVATDGIARGVAGTIPDWANRILSRLLSPPPNIAADLL